MRDLHIPKQVVTTNSAQWSNGISNNGSTLCSTEEQSIDNNIFFDKKFFFQVGHPVNFSTGERYTHVH